MSVGVNDARLYAAVEHGNGYARCDRDREHDADRTHKGAQDFGRKDLLIERHERIAPEGGKEQEQWEVCSHIRDSKRVYKRANVLATNAQCARKYMRPRGVLVHPQQFLHGDRLTYRRVIEHAQQSDDQAAEQ